MNENNQIRSVERPRRNRVTPFGKLEATQFKGKYLGNRGDLLRKDGTLGRNWQGRRWITCSLTYRGSDYRVTFDQPGSYYPLFFADEAVAFAAGHRPCAQCRRVHYDRFRASWARAHGTSGGNLISADDMDAILHAARLTTQKEQKTYSATLESLPDGVFVTPSNDPEAALLWWKGRLHPWSHAGYGAPCTEPKATLVNVLTPMPIVEILEAGYEPDVAV